MKDKNHNQAEILEKAISKAIDGGWIIPFEEPIVSVEVTQEDVEGTYQTEPYLRFELDGTHDWCVGIPAVIFNHDFAKSLWGDEPSPMKIWQEDKIGTPDYRTEERTVAYIENWKQRLMEMVIADDPIKYLGANL